MTLTDYHWAINEMEKLPKIANLTLFPTILNIGVKNRSETELDEVKTISNMILKLTITLAEFPS